MPNARTSTPTWNELATLAGYAGADDAWERTDGPFWELINFSDCEGVIGPKTSAKLAGDFAAFQEKADAHHGQWFGRSMPNGARRSIWPAMTAPSRFIESSEGS